MTIAAGNSTELANVPSPVAALTGGVAIVVYGTVMGQTHAGKRKDHQQLHQDPPLHPNLGNPAAHTNELFQLIQMNA